MKIIVVGCGRFGSELALRLARREHKVVVVDPRRSAFDRLGADFRGRTVEGIPFDRDVLEWAGVAEADALAALTPDDSTNILVARLAQRTFAIPRVVARLYDPRRAEIYETLDIQYVSTVRWGVNRVAQLLCHPGLHNVLSLSNGEVEVYELWVPPALEGWGLEPFQTLEEVSVVALTHAGHTSLPNDSHRLSAGDVLYLAVTRRGGTALEALLALHMPLGGDPCL